MQWDGLSEKCTPNFWVNCYGVYMISSGGGATIINNTSFFVFFNKYTVIRTTFIWSKIQNNNSKMVKTIITI